MVNNYTKFKYMILYFFQKKKNIILFFLLKVQATQTSITKSAKKLKFLLFI